MFDIFKRKKKQAESSQAEAEITETEASVEAEEIVEAVVDPAIERAQAPETTVPQEMLKAGEPASEDTVFFQEEADASIEQPAEKKKGFFSRLATGLSKTRSGFSDGVANLLLGKKEIDDDLLEDLETQLIMADVGVEATREIMAKLTERVGRKELTDSDALFEADRKSVV